MTVVGKCSIAGLVKEVGEVGSSGVSESKVVILRRLGLRRGAATILITRDVNSS